ncbi:MAG: hypothetical protein Q9201_002441 [Fulgogasparrea decipioides]
MSCTSATTGSNEAGPEQNYLAERHGSKDSIGSEETLTEESEAAQPRPPSPFAPVDGQPTDTSSHKGGKTSFHDNAETASIGLRLSRVSSYLDEAFRSGWRQVQHKKLPVCQAAYLLVINVTLLVVGLITLLTSNQPTDVDRRSLDAEMKSLEMQKVLLEQDAQAAKTSSEALDSQMHSLNVEKESLELLKASLEKERLELEIQKQTLELAKWSAYHEYIVGCAAYAKEKVTSDRCVEALKAFDQPPPHLPNDPTLEISRRKLNEASDRYGLTAIKTQDGSTSFKSFMAATTMMATLPSLSSPASSFVASANHQSGVWVYVAVAVLFALIVLVAIFATSRTITFGIPIEYRLWLNILKANETIPEREVEFDFDEKLYMMEPTSSPDLNISLASGTGAPLPVGLRNRKDNTRQLTAKGDIWTATFHGDTTAVQELLAAGSLSSIDEVHPRFGTPLQAGAQGGHLTVVKIFLKLQANANAYGGRFHSPLQAAAYSGEVGIVRILLSHGASANATGGSCGSPLLAAVEKGSLEMVRSLIDAGADVHQYGGIYGYALQIASFRGSEGIVSLLLDQGADVNARGGCYDTALLASTMEGHVHIVKLLLQHQININWPSESYGSALQIACRQDHPKIAQLLIEKGADTSVRDDQRRTPLHEAARSG